LAGAATTYETSPSLGVSRAAEEDFQDANAGSWGDDDILDDDDRPQPARGAAEVKAKGWEEDDLDLGDVDADMPKGSVASGRTDDYVSVTAGTPPYVHWVDSSSHPADHVAAGSFETAMQVHSCSCVCLCRNFQSSTAAPQTNRCRAV
jgi:coatomer protein complex subunit alpha (xenin)